MPDTRYGFVGAGRMATALASGMVQGGLATGGQILASDPSPEAAKQFVTATGGSIAGNNAEVASHSDVIILAVKPQQMTSALKELQPTMRRECLVVSVAAGVPLAAIALVLSTGADPSDCPRLVRVMPNTPCLIGQGASAYALGPGATPADAELVARLLSAVGKAHLVEEKLLDAVTGLSGSGPAFVYALIEALGDGGVRMGLPRELALALAAQTVRGAAEMVLSTGQHPALLKDQVASPGGTTMSGLVALEAGGFRSAAIAAVVAATERSCELGRAS